MRTPISRVWIGLALGSCLGVLAPSYRLVCAQVAAPLPDSTAGNALEERLRRVEEVNAQLLQQLKRDREESNRRYGELDARYRELLHRVGEPRPSSDAETPPAPGEPTGRSSHLGRPGELGRPLATREVPLSARFADGFQLATDDDEFDLRLHVLDQTSFKIFAPNDRTFGKSGAYVPRVRVYFEGRLTRFWEYEVSLQRSLDGVWDLLDGNLNLRLAKAFQLKFGRTLVPYSYDWFDHLEQYFIAPERALFPLNFGLSRQAGVMGWGLADNGRLDWAVGGFNGHLTGVADNNPNQEAVGYFNFRPFLGRDRDPFPALRQLNLGASLAIGQVARDELPLPLRTSIQAAENDVGTTDASAVFLNFNPGTVYRGNTLFGAAHLAYYFHGISFESEWNIGQFQMTRPGLVTKPNIPVQGFYTTLAYLVTGEEIDRRTTVVPLRPFRPLRGQWGPGAIEPYVRYSQLNLGDILFKTDLANGRFWTDAVSMVDLGMNWYPNRWVKFYIEWQHAAFGSPVLVNEAKGVFSRSSDLFWLRCQFYY